MDTNPKTCRPADEVLSWARRDFLRLTGLSTLGLLTARLPAVAGPFTAADFEQLVPSDKKLSAAWLRSLVERGAPTVYRGVELGIDRHADWRRHGGGI